MQLTVFKYDVRTTWFNNSFVMTSFASITSKAKGRPFPSTRTLLRLNEEKKLLIISTYILTCMV